MKLLVVNPELPQFDRTSGGLRLFTFIALLRAQGCECDYLVSTPQAERSRIGEQDWAHYEASLRTLGVPLITRPLREALRANRYDVVVFEFFHVARPFLRLVRALQPQARLVVDSVDLTYLRWHAKADLSGTEADRAHARQVQADELDTYRRSDLVLTLTDDEADELRRRIPGIATHNLPNIHSMPALERDEAPHPELLFIGSFTHEPNVDAVRWFHAEIWPLIRQHRPDAEWVIIGANAPDDIVALNGNGIRFEGRVPSTEPYLGSAWVSLAPLRFGAGMKGKVGEALAGGLPVVTTAFGAQGYGVEHGVSGMIADTAEDFAQAVLKLVDDPALRQRIGHAGRALIAGRFSSDAVAGALPQLLDTLSRLPQAERLVWPALARVHLSACAWWAQHVAWRLR